MQVDPSIGKPTLIKQFWTKYKKCAMIAVSVFVIRGNTEGGKPTFN